MIKSLDFVAFFVPVRLTLNVNSGIVYLNWNIRGFLYGRQKV